MSSDRGTMQRGPAPGIDQPGAWSEPTAPAGRRVPSAPRERKPVLAALAALLILGGALGAGFLVLQSGKRVPAIEISQQIGAGQKIPLSAMQEIQIASGTGLSYVPWNQASQVANYYAASAIPAGTLLTGAMVVQANEVTTGKYVLGLALKPYTRSAGRPRAQAAMRQAGSRWLRTPSCSLWAAARAHRHPDRRLRAPPPMSPWRSARPTLAQSPAMRPGRMSRWPCCPQADKARLVAPPRSGQGGQGPRRARPRRHRHRPGLADRWR